MEKYILQILENNSRVIVPEFGAFIIKQKNPLTIVFNEFLQYNDGVLVDAIAKNEGTDRDSAKKKIDEFVEAINSQLDKGNSFSIEQLGVLIKSSTGKISLEKDSAGKSSTASNSKKTEKKAAQAKNNIKAVEKPEEEAKKEISDNISNTELKKDIKEKPVEIKEKVEDTGKKEDEIPKEKPKEVKQEKLEEKLEEKKAAEQEEKEPKKSSVEITPPKKEESKPQDEATFQKRTMSATAPERRETNTKRSGHYTPRTVVPSKEPKRKTNLWLWVILILVINGIIITYFIMSDQLGGLFKKPVELPADEVHDMTIEPEDDGANDMMIIEPEEQIIEKEPSTPVPEKPPVVTGKRYYVVAGVFREEQNADNLVIELRNQGYNSEKFGKIGNLYAVSFGVYTTSSEAEREMQRIKKEVNPEAWIKVMN